MTNALWLFAVLLDLILLIGVWELRLKLRMPRWGAWILTIALLAIILWLGTHPPV